MAYSRAVNAGKKLNKFGDKQLEVGEQKYGSGDKYVQDTPLDQMLMYTKDRISTCLETMQAHKGNHEILLGDCLNHLRFVLARIEYEELRAVLQTRRSRTTQKKPLQKKKRF